ncbi:uncharacterized protein [Triticum aestivum]|uniref:uncharacterized protein isoform X2 n=1 Tax=Triticum aestivum TaxID=4565 RepID=UPI000E7BFD48|nr:uncharacterized protein LOC123133446 isoform X2 [Triticum aestivum]
MDRGTLERMPRPTRAERQKRQTNLRAKSINYYIYRNHHKRFLKKSFRLLQFSFFTAQRLQRSDDVCKEGKMQTSNAEDVFKALDEIEFPELVEPLRTALDGLCCCLLVSSILLQSDVL